MQYFDKCVAPSAQFRTLTFLEAVKMLNPESEERVQLPKSPASSEAGSHVPRPQTAARAAKRQRGRERRKHFKALAREPDHPCSETTRATLTRNFEERAAAVASEVKLVVKSTFFDVSEDEASSSENDVPLPASFRPTTREIDQWRRDYRRFRLGHHQGAKGEVSKLPATENALPWLDLRTNQPTSLAALAA
jgi:hypothetical protein